ncbi:MAG: squalene synthase HpnC [Burkholderiaceae bacterium]|nr:squalene synthase HpnC [Burkholderiaceae bacterium]
MATPLARSLTSSDHYENFPVASILVPARLRPAIAALYRFARHADDLADEGDASADQRLEALEALGQELRAQRPDSPLVARLRRHWNEHRLPWEPLHALLSAFAQDAAAAGDASPGSGLRHRDRASLLDYCSRSANPVGELILRLFGSWNEQTRGASDAICTGLQLLNFVQDFAVDWRRGRLYVPLDELHAAGLDERDIERALEAGRVEPRLAALLAQQTEAAVALLQSGRSLVRYVPWRLALELRAIVGGGLRIAERLRASGYDPVAERPTLGWRDAPALARLALASGASR